MAQYEKEILFLSCVKNWNWEFCWFIINCDAFIWFWSFLVIEKKTYLLIATPLWPYHTAVLLVWCHLLEWASISWWQYQENFNRRIWKCSCISQFKSMNKFIDCFQCAIEIMIRVKYHGWRTCLYHFHLWLFLLYICSSIRTVAWALLYLAIQPVVDVCNNLVVSDTNVAVMRPNKAYLTT